MKLILHIALKDLRRQRLAPAELIVAVGTRHGESAELSCRAVTAALGELADPGVLIEAVPETAAVPDAAGIQERNRWVSATANAARSPWVVPWHADGGYDDSYLLDLACARECSQADAVGYAGASYAYVTSLEPALARREFFAADSSSRGLRLFSFS